MRRRDFIKGIAGSAVTWPLVAHAQQEARMRRVGVLMSTATDDGESHARVAAFVEGLDQFGWADGRNVRIEYRWTAGDVGLGRRYSSELVALSPDVIVAGGSEALATLQQATRNIPIVFVNVADPLGAGFVDSLARPGGNTTGFLLFEFGISPKWLELLKEIAPRITRAAVVRDASIPSGIAQLAAIQAVAPSLGVEISPIGMRDTLEIEQALGSFAQTPNGGIIVAGTPASVVHRGLIVSLAARHRVPPCTPCDSTSKVEA